MVSSILAGVMGENNGVKRVLTSKGGWYFDIYTFFAGGVAYATLRTKARGERRMGQKMPSGWTPTKTTHGRGTQPSRAEAFDSSAEMR
jgi:hypothetical protein